MMRVFLLCVRGSNLNTFDFRQDFAKNIFNLQLWRFILGTGFVGFFFSGLLFHCTCANHQQPTCGKLAGCLLACSLAGWRACWLPGRLARLFAASLACFLSCCSDGWLVCFLAVKLAGSLAAWRTCLLARWMAFLLACFHPYFHPCSSGCPCFPCFPWGDVFLRICFFSVWGTFPCYLLHFGAKTSTLLNFAAKICHLHCSPIFPWFLSVFPWCSLIYPKFSSFHWVAHGFKRCFHGFDRFFHA